MTFRAFFYWLFALFVSFNIFSGALRGTVSGGPVRSLRDTMEAGAPGQSSARAPERVEGEFAPGTDSAIILRECFSIRTLILKTSQW